MAFLKKLMGLKNCFMQLLVKNSQVSLEPGMSAIIMCMVKVQSLKASIL